MAVAHAFGFARDLNLNCPTETSTFVHHQSPRFSVPLSCLLAHREAQAEPRRLSYPQAARVVAGMCPTTSTANMLALMPSASQSSGRVADKL